MMRPSFIFFNALSIIKKAQTAPKCNITRALKGMGKQEEAGIYIECALAIAQKLDDSKIKSAAFIALIPSMFMQGNLVNAFEYLKKGEEELLRINLCNGLLSIYNNLAAIKFYRGVLVSHVLILINSRTRHRL
ncbi:MAG: hypothetical protein ACJA0X_002479 [Cyclobacteriaceae bacterium]|jgi:hypothetical protein